MNDKIFVVVSVDDANHRSRILGATTDKAEADRYAWIYNSGQPIEGKARVVPFTDLSAWTPAALG